MARIWAVFVTTLALLLPSLAGAAEPKPLRSWQFDGLRFVADDAGGLQVWDVRDAKQPILVDMRAMGGPVVDLRLDRGVVVAVVVAPRPVLLTVDGTGRLGDYTPVVPAQDATAVTLDLPRKGRPPFEIGRVVAVQHGLVEVALDDLSGVRQGRAIRIRSRDEPGLDGSSLSLDPDDLPAEDAALPRVVRIVGQRAVAELPRGVTVEVGDRVERTAAPPVTLRWFPPVSLYDGWVQVGIRPVLPVGQTIGMGLEFGAGVNLGMLQVQVRAQPLTVANTGWGPTQVLAEGSVEGDHFGFGLGVGTIFAVDRWCGWSFDLPRDCSDWFTAVAGRVRAGSQDGLHVGFGLSFYDDGDEFGVRPGQFDGELVVPVSRTGDFRMGWLARDDYALFEVGGRFYLQGVGGRDTTVLTFGFGGVEIDIPDGSDLEGPHFTLGIEMRR